MHDFQENHLGVHIFLFYNVCMQNTKHLHGLQKSQCLIILTVLYLQEAICAYAIIIMAVFWITEALPIAVTALLPVFLFPIIGLLSVKATSQQYINVSFNQC